MFLQTNDIIIPLKLTLKTLKIGLIKNITIDIQEINKLTGKIEIKQITKTIKIEKGMKNDEKFIFENEGNEEIGKLRGNLIIQLEIISKEGFIRNNENLILYYKITKEEMKNGFLCSFRNYDGEKLFKQIEKNSIHFNNFDDRIIFYGKGLPLFNNNTAFGDVIVIFYEGK